MDKIFAMDKGDMPELNCFCSLDHTKGIGKLLITKWEEELLKRNIHRYHLFTDDNCNFKWYEQNAFKLIEHASINIDDLEEIKKYHEHFYIYHFEKEI